MKVEIIDEVVIPASLDASGDDDFVTAVELGNTVEEFLLGTRDLAWSPRDLLSEWLDPYGTKRMLVARRDGRIVGRGTYEVQSGDGVASAWLSAEVLPEYRRRGIGSRILDRLEALAGADGRSVLQCFSVHSSADGPRIDSPTGFGSVPVADPSVPFALARGYRLAQVERTSRLPLPRTATDATSAVPDGYDFQSWVGRPPDDRLADLAVLHARMSTDVPLGETDAEAELWDEQRVRDDEDRKAQTDRIWLTVAARHVASDALVGYTQFALPADVTMVYQQDTIVMREHRGHRLGMHMKRENLRLLAAVAPARTAVYTWNAEENRHMLSVNEQLGFVPVGYSANWRRDI